MSRKVPDKTIEEIRFKNDIVDVIGSYFHVQKAGSAFKALCPFHKEKTPSFHVNPQKQIFHCFGCGAGGDVFKFLMQYEGVSFMMAVKMLAEKAGVKLELEDGDTAEASDRTELFKILADVAALYHQALKERNSAAHARAYLAKRDLGEDTIGTFQIGYSPDRWDAVLKWGLDNKYSLERLEKAGLILRKEGTQGSVSDYYDRFRNRVMFPIRDEQGRVVGFSGRTLDEADKSAKYVNTPETPLFHKGRILYALDHARRHIVESREAIICEGQIDVIRCHQAGFVTAVAAQGTAFTEDHVRTLRRYADSVVLVFDPDKAGQDAAIRASAIFMQAGLAVRVGALPTGKDPDLFIRENGADGFKRVIANAQTAVAFQINVLSQREDAKSEVGVMRIARAVLQTIMSSPNAVQRAKLVQEAAGRLGLPASAMQEDLRRLVRQQYRHAESDEVAEGAPSDDGPAKDEGQPKEEVQLCEHLAHVIDEPQLGEVVKKYLPLDKLSDPRCRAFAQAALESAETGRDIMDIVRGMDDDAGALQVFAAGIQMAPHRFSRGEFGRIDAVRDIVLFIWRREFEKERSDLQRRIAQAPSQDGESRCRQLTLDIKALRRWDDGTPIIEIALAGQGTP